MATEIQPEKLDDIQLSIYLAQQQYSGYGTVHVTKCAAQILDWIKEMRTREAKLNRTAIQEILNNQ